MSTGLIRATTSQTQVASPQTNTNTNGFPDEPLLDLLLTNQMLFSEKSAPTDLKEQINAQTEAGAQLFVQNNTGDIIAQTNKFFLGAFSFSMKERTQLLETFNASSIAFFGENARIYNFAGTAVDYAGSRAPRYYQSSLIKMYNDMLRGTLLVERKQVAIMMIANHTIYGYPLTFGSTYDASRDKVASFTMQWLVTEHYLTLPGVVDEVQLEHTYTYSSDLSGAGSVEFKVLQETISLLNNFFYFKNWIESGETDFNFLIDRDWASLTPYDLGGFSSPSIFIDRATTKLTEVEEGLLALDTKTDYSPTLMEMFSSATTVTNLAEAIADKFTTWISSFNKLWSASGVRDDTAFITLKGDLKLLEMLYRKLLTFQRARLAQLKAAADG